MRRWRPRPTLPSRLLDSATGAREAIEDARDEAIGKLRDKGVDTTATLKSFDELLKSAQESEKTARESLSAIQALRHSTPPDAAASVPPQASLPPVVPAVPAVPTAPPASLALPTQPLPSGAPGAADVPAAGSATPKAADTIAHGRKFPTATIAINFDSDLPGAVLPQEVRDDIRAKVAGDVWRIGVGSALILLFIPLFVMLLIAKYLIGRSRRALAFAEEKKQEAKISDVSRQLTEARLQALQAQVEPHFLYNTLANVQALTETDAPAANAMVGHLIQYLRAALPKMRDSTSTVGQEVELVAAYLSILKMRMGSRLEFAIDVPPELSSKPFPPMMLPSLVENAIKHGLEPLREGGRIDIVATRIATARGERIRVQVRDTGTGLPGTLVENGGGVGLVNLRERLAGLYGDDASFVIESNISRGVIATIEIPVEIPVEKPADSPTAAAAAPGSTPQALPTGWRRAWQATTRTHNAWAWIASRLFFGLMFALALAFLLALIGLYTGWLPIAVGDSRLQGVEGMALGSILLLVGFAVSAVAIAVVVAVFYGLGFLFAALLVFISAIVLISLFPVLAPFILIGLGIYWFWWKRKKRAGNSDAV